MSNKFQDSNQQSLGDVTAVRHAAAPPAQLWKEDWRQTAEALMTASAISQLHHGSSALLSVVKASLSKQAAATRTAAVFITRRGAKVTDRNRHADGVVARRVYTVCRSLIFLPIFLMQGCKLSPSTITDLLTEETSFGREEASFSPPHSDWTTSGGG